MSCVAVDNRLSLSLHFSDLFSGEGEAKYLYTEIKKLDLV